MHVRVQAAADWQKKIMQYVYILISEKDRTKFYIGETSDLDKRVKEHNKGCSYYTKRYMPWRLEIYIVFHSSLLAKQFERYLKSGSGKTFLKRRLMAL